MMKKFWIIILLFLVVAFKHPFYLSVTELKYNVKEKALQGSVKVFLNDIENALKKINGKPVDLSTNVNRVELKALVKAYLLPRITVQVNGAQKRLNVIGFEKEEEAIFIYIEFTKCDLPKKIDITNIVLYDFIPDQTNIVRLEVQGKQQSFKVTNPETQINFSFE